MSGEVRVKGDAAQAAGATGRGGLLVIEGNAGARCGISMKGIDIVVGGSIGHMSGFMAQEGNLVVCGDAADTLGDSLYEARIFVRGTVKTLGADCEEKAMGAEERGILHALLDRAALGFADRCIGIPALRIRAAAVPFPRRQRRRLLRWPWTRRSPASPSPAQVGDVRSARHRRDPARRGDRHLRHPRLRREAQAAAFRRSAVPRRIDVALSAGRLSRALRHRCGAGDAARQAPDRAEDPGDHRRHELRCTCPRQAKEALGRGASAVGTSTTTGDGGMTTEEREHSRILVYQCLPSRYGMNLEDLRKADAIEVVVGQGAKPGGGGMLLGQKISPRVAQMRNLPEGIDQRSACRHPDWTGPDDLDDQDRGTARDHRLGEADLREGRRQPPLLRYRPGGEGGRRCRGAGRHAGRHRGDAGGVHRACRSADARRDPPGRAGAAGAWRASRGAADRLRRHPQRRRCGEGTGAWCRCGRHRHRGADRARRQRSRAGRGVSRTRLHRRLLRRLARRTRSGGHHDAGPGAGGAARSGAGRATAGQLSCGDDAGGAGDRARLRQEPSAQSGAGGSGGADAGSRSDDPGAARGNRVVPGQAGRLHDDRSGRHRARERHPIFPDLVRRPARSRCARSSCPRRRSAPCRRTAPALPASLCISTWRRRIPTCSPCRTRRA